MVRGKHLFYSFRKSTTDPIFDDSAQAYLHNPLEQVQAALTLAQDEDNPTKLIIH